MKICICLICKRKFLEKDINRIRKFCSFKCMGISRVGKYHDGSFKKGHKSFWTEKTKEMMSLFMLGNKNAWKGSHQKNERNDPAYQLWVKQCKKRDKQCKLKNEDCDGYLVVHHIKSWRDYPELRYELTNGITLCQAHHPRKRAKEIQMIPKLSVLVGNNV